MSRISSVTFDPDPAAPGEAVTMTVTGDWAGLPLQVEDPAGGGWEPVSGDGTVAVFRGHAPAAWPVTVTAGETTLPASLGIRG